MAKFQGLCCRANGDPKEIEGYVVPNPMPSTPAECLRRCMKYADAKGCSYYTMSRICYVVTDMGAGAGDGRVRGTCWKLVLKKSAGNFN